jgi:hypothetical protein
MNLFHFKGLIVIQISELHPTFVVMHQTTFHDKIRTNKTMPSNDLHMDNIT